LRGGELWHDPGSACADLRDGGDWEKIDNAEVALEDQRDVDLTAISTELSNNR
jgi:hypothetical protein